MQKHHILNNQFLNLSFQEKINKSYFGWCSYLLSMYFSKKLYKNLKNDFTYFKGYMNIPELLFYLAIAFLFITNIVLFPVYAFILKIYWKYRYIKTLKNSQAPITDMIVYDPVNTINNGVKIIKIINEQTTQETTYYKVLLETKEICTLSKENILFEKELINKKIALEKELRQIEFSLNLFVKKIGLDKQEGN